MRRTGEDSIELQSMSTLDPELIDVREEIFGLSPRRGETLGGTAEQT